MSSTCYILESLLCMLIILNRDSEVDVQIFF